MRARGCAAALAALVLMVGCSDDGGDDAGGDATATTTAEGGPTTTTTTPDAGGLEVELTGPITGGQRGLPYNAMPEGMAEDAGYVEEELFVSGTATSYTSAAPLTADGAWEVEAAATAPYTTRIIVRRPADDADFNGVVLVEWLNVSAGRDSDPDFGFLHPLLLAEGYGYVGVSAQEVGVEGGESRLEIPGVPPEALAPLQVWDPERYEPLDHPGDAFSYDLFTQIGRLARGEAPDGPFEGLDVTHVIAAGESQSASRMVTYVDAVHPVAGVFDGFLVHSRGGGAAPLNDEPTGEPPDGTRIRGDIDVSVLQFQTETDITGLGFVAARQPDAGNLVTWEVAGTAHADQSTLDYGIASGARWSDVGGIDLTATCGDANTGPQAAVLRAAFDGLRAWIVDGRPLPSAPPIEVAGEEIVRDDLGIAVGGVRTPAVDAPAVVLTGAGNPVSVFCSLFGQTFPMPPGALVARYGSSAGYVDAVRAAAEAAVEAGHLLEADAEAMIAAAADVVIA